jgi:hypothetical protein
VGIESRDIKPEQSEAAQFATFKHYVGLGKSEPANSLPSRKHPPDNVREGLFSLAIATLEAVGRIEYGIACYRSESQIVGGIGLYRQLSWTHLSISRTLQT